MVRIALALAILASILTGWVSLNTNEVQPAVIVIGVSCFLLGVAVPRLALLWAAIVGLGVFGGYALAGLLGIAVKAPPEPNIWASLIALVPALVASLLGAFTGHFARTPMSPQA